MSTAEHSLVHPTAANQKFLGMLSCLLAAICYSAANVCLREVALKHDPSWVMLIKESVSALVLGPFLLLLSKRGKISCRAG